ncbi:MAG TPA: DUF2441 domain-containing protein [Gallionella sp.]|nr:DUF2441 domain-containing protein [Gallionella sp.]
MGKMAAESVDCKITTRQMLHMNNRYFYCYSLPLEVGSIIRPGNWGRILRTYTPQSPQNPWLLTRELAFELARIKNYPNKPSRLDCLFICLNEGDLNEFRTASNRPFDLMYEVELVNPDAPSHIGDWTIANIQSTDNISIFEDRANAYWQDNNAIKQEFLTLSPIRITRIIL